MSDNLKLIIDYTDRVVCEIDEEYEIIRLPIEIKKAMQEENKNLLRELEICSGTHFNFINSYSSMSEWPNFSQQYNNAIRYPCLFPNRTIISTPFGFSEELSWDKIRYEPCFYRLLKTQRELIENGMVKIYFAMTFYKKDYDYLPNQVPKAINVLNENFESVRHSLHIQMPWLHEARYQDYIELIDNSTFACPQLE